MPSPGLLTLPTARSFPNSREPFADLYRFKGMMLGYSGLLFLADLVLLIHLGFVAFVVLGLVAIWVGWFAKARFVRHWGFRLAHLAAMGVVVLETAFGIMCPLTVWEHQLRVAAGSDSLPQGTFMQHWCHEVLFLDLSHATFLVIYVVFFLAMLLSLVVVRPDWPKRVPVKVGQTSD